MYILSERGVVSGNGWTTTTVSTMDEDDWEARLADVEWQRLQAARDQDGLRDGLAEGKERALQAGFDQGFREGFQLLRQVAVWRGLVRSVPTHCCRALR